MKNILLQEQVLHNVFGIGVVVEQEERMLMINFPEYGEKNFLYPDAFEHYLKMCDPKLHAAVQKYLNKKKPEIEAEREYKQHLYEKELQRQADEIAQFAIIREKFAPKKKPLGKVKLK